MACCLETLQGHKGGVTEAPALLPSPPTHTQRPPDVQLLPEHEVVVEVGDGPVHGVSIRHLHHGCPRFALHELHLPMAPGVTQRSLYKGGRGGEGEGEGKGGCPPQLTFSTFP